MLQFIYKKWLVICLSQFFFACKKEELPVKPLPSPFSANLETNTSFPAAGAAGKIIINAGTDGWWVTMPANDWCVINKKFGSGDYALALTIKANNSGAPRSVTVTIHPTFDLATVDITITQAN